MGEIEIKIMQVRCTSWESDGKGEGWCINVKCGMYKGKISRMIDLMGYYGI